MRYLNRNTSDDPTPSYGSSETPSGNGAGSGFTVRPLGRQDIDEIAAVEARVFDSPWSPGMFALELAKPGSFALAAIRSDRIIGYLFMSRYHDAWHLMNVAVAPGSRRAGVATRLIATALGEVDDQLPVTLEVRPSNPAAISLYENLGFRGVAVRRGYYPNDGEDALIMWRGDPSRAGVPVEALQGAGT